MKKLNLKSIILLLMAIFTGVTFFACNDDDEKEDISLTKTFIGEWVNDTDTMVFYRNGLLDFNGKYDEIKSNKNQRYSVLSDTIIKIDVSEYEYVMNTFHNDSIVLTICPYNTNRIDQQYKGVSLTKVKK